MPTKRKPKFSVGQVVWCISGDYPVKIASITPEDEYPFQGREYGTNEGLRGERDLRRLTKREATGR